MPPKISDQEQRLISAYIEGANRIARLLASGKATSRTRAQADAVLSQLRSVTKEYLGKGLPEQFRRGSAEAVKKLQGVKGLRIDETFTQLHKEALQQLSDDAALGFGRSLQEIKRDVERAITNSRKEEIIGEILASEVAGEDSAANVKKQFEDAGVIGIRTPTRTLSIEHYVSTITHTVLADAHNMGAATRYMQNGVQFGRRIERASAPDYPCQWLRNKIVWLGERRFVGAIHPNCMGGIAPYFGDTSEAYRSIDDPRIPAEVRDALAKR